VKTSGRLLRLLWLLQSRPSWTGRELSERVDVDERTIRRDMDRLRELGYAVEATSGSGGGYRLRAGSSMPPVLLDDEEAVAVAVAVRAAASSIGRMEETALSLLAKLDQLLPARLRKRATALHSVTLSLARREPPVAIDILTRVASACRDRMRMRLNYRDRRGNTSQRSIEPLRLVHTGSRWYLVAWDLQREDWRTFRMDRIERAATTGQRFEPREFPGDVAEYVARSISSAPFRYQMRLRIAGSLKELAERIPSWCGVLEPLDDGHCVLRIGGDSIEGLVALLALVGSDFEVLEPPEFVNEVQQVIARLGRGLTARLTSQGLRPGQGRA
jgi:predicted DNA-binding transcriptional regulator YafY